MLIAAIERLTGRVTLERLYREVLALPSDTCSVWETALDKLHIHLACDPNKIAQIPSEGPIVLIANHPFGVVDGIMIGHLASQIRVNFQILTNSVLCDLERVGEHLLPVDFQPTKAAMLTNIATKNRALATLQEGGAVVIFPGGGVATARGWWGPAYEFDWKPFVAKLVRVAKATVVPLYFHGQNSRLFHIVSQYSLTLRLAMLLNEVRNKMGHTLTVTIGDSIPFTDLAAIKNRLALTEHLYRTTVALAQQP